MDLDIGVWLQSIEASEAWSIIRDTFYGIPFWLRASLFSFVLVAGVLSKWLLPALTAFAHARKSEK